MKRALVTGASGFLGSHLIAGLHAAGWQVRALSRRPVAGVAEHHAIDLTQLPLDAKLLDQIDAIFHLATWQPGFGDPALAWRLNVETTEALGNLAQQTDVAHFCFISSAAAMGNALGSPLNEQSDCHPVSLYERSKREAELRLLAIAGLQPLILRPPMISGPGLNGGPLLKMIKLCQQGRFPVFGGRRSMAKPLVHVTDLVDAMLRGEADRVGGEIVLITSGQPHPLGDILDCCAEFLGQAKVTLNLPLLLAQLAATISTPICAMSGRESPLSTARLAMFLADRRFDIAKARKLLGYDPQVTKINDLLVPTFEHLRQSGQL